MSDAGLVEPVTTHTPSGAEYTVTIPRGAYDVSVSAFVPLGSSPALHDNAREIVQHIANMSKKAFVGAVVA